MIYSDSEEDTTETESESSGIGLVSKPEDVEKPAELGPVSMPEDVKMPADLGLVCMQADVEKPAVALKRTLQEIVFDTVKAFDLEMKTYAVEKTVTVSATVAARPPGSVAM